MVTQDSDPFVDGVDEQLDDDVEMITGDVTCENCVHAEVCQLFAAMRRNVAEYEQDRQDESPVPPGVLAVRCDLFEQDD